MTDILADWKYTDRVNSGRRAALAEPGCFEETIRWVVEDARDIKVRYEPGWDHSLTECGQPVFSLQLPNSGDAFFNGPYGYRAQYYLSAGANATVLARLSAKLLDALNTKTEPKFEEIDVYASLHAASAKIWILEMESEFRNASADLNVERWHIEATNGVDLARRGLVAPPMMVFEVKGALLDPNGHEVVPCYKIMRHYQLNKYGFS